MDLSAQNILFFLGTVLTSGWLGSVIVQWLKGRSDRDTALTGARLGREGQLDDLTKDLIDAAKADIKDLRHEIGLLRPLQNHLLHFEESIYHLESLVTAATEEDLRAARGAAAAFLNRIDRTRQAIGQVRNDIQVARAERNLRTRGRLVDDVDGDEN